MNVALNWTRTEQYVKSNYITASKTIPGEYYYDQEYIADVFLILLHIYKKPFFYALPPKISELDTLFL